MLVEGTGSPGFVNPSPREPIVPGVATDGPPHYQGRTLTLLGEVPPGLSLIAFWHRLERSKSQTYRPACSRAQRAAPGRRTPPLVDSGGRRGRMRSVSARAP